MKVCNKCKLELSLDNYHKRNRQYIKKDGTISVYKGYQDTCIGCSLKFSKEYKKTEKYKAYEKEYKSTRKYKDKANTLKRTSEKKRIQALIQNARTRAKKKGLECDINWEDISIPDMCPLLDVPLIWGTRNNYMYSPSIDRIDPLKGYTKDNIQILSMKANTMKNSASQEELITFAKNILFKI
jgi:hypothetical protein